MIESVGDCFYILIKCINCNFKVFDGTYEWLDIVTKFFREPVLSHECQPPFKPELVIIVSPVTTKQF